MEGDDYLDRRLGDFLEQLSSEESPPGGGAAAALTVSFAAGLVTMVARHSRPSWEEAAGIAAQARTLQARVAPLAQANARAWIAALEALGGKGKEAGEDGKLEKRLARAAEVPLEIAERAADVAQLAALAAERCEGTYRADAATAAVLAGAGATAAAHLVAINLAVADDDERLVRARRNQEIAAAAATRALDAGP